MFNHPLTLACDVGGVPNRWVDYREVAYYHSKDLIDWAVGDNEYTIYGGHSSITGDISSIDVPSIIAVRGEVVEKVTHHHVPKLTNRALFSRDRFICAYCGRHFQEKKLTRDHIIPSSQGGENTWKNVVASCTHCNQHKDSRTPEEANMELLYVPYVPDRAEWLILMNRKILGDQMEFLMNQVRNKNSRLFKEFGER